MAEELLTYGQMVEAFSLAMRPERHCPNCGCCTRALCEAGRQGPPGCIGRTSVSDSDLRARIAACPCPAPPALSVPDPQEPTS